MNAKVRNIRQEVNAELARLNKERDGLRPSEVVEAAHAEDSPLHSEFEWNNKKASVEYRLIQARKLIRLAVVILDGGKEDRYVHIPATEPEAHAAESGEGVYRPISVVVQDEDWYARALGGLMVKLRAATEAAQELQEAAQQGSHEPERLAKIGLAISALNTASAALSTLH